MALVEINQDLIVNLSLLIDKYESLEKNSTNYTIHKLSKEVKEELISLKDLLVKDLK